MPPAARITDLHACPAESPEPHVGGPIITGSPNVLINGLPAATVGSVAVCDGPPSMVVMGSTGVFINGKPAARMGDLTAHGGAIVIGSPDVLIGEVGGGAPGFSGFNAILQGLIAMIPTDQDSSWVSRFGKGLFDSTLKPLGEMIAHPIATVEGIAHAAMHPMQTAKAIGKAVRENASGVMSGDAKSMGVAVGTVGMIFVPGAGEVEGAEDAARMGKVGELAEEGNAASTVSKSIASESHFVTNGVYQSTAVDYLSNSADGQRFIKELREAAPSQSDEQIVTRAIGQVQSGSELPAMQENFAGPLVKLVPQGGEVSSYSPYFTTPDQLNEAIASGKPLGDSFGLPLASQADAYDVYTISPPDGGGTVFSSPIAPTSEGQFTTSGGAMQYLVPNRAGWSPPSLLGTLGPK